MLFARASVFVLVCACGASSSRVAPVAPTKAPAPAAALDPCQRAVLASLEGPPAKFEIELLSSSSDLDAASYDAWLRALGRDGGVRYRWRSIDDDAGRDHARRVGVNGMGVVIDAGVDRDVANLAGPLDATAATRIAFAARGVLDQATKRRRVASDDAALRSRLSRETTFVPIELARGVPADVDVLVVTQTERALGEPERKAIDAFLMRGNKVVVVMASAAQVDRDAKEIDVEPRGLDALLAPYGVDLAPELVVDTTDGLRLGSTLFPALPIATVESSLPFFDLKKVVFPFASGLSLAPGRQPGASLRVIARTSATSRGVTGKLRTDAPVPAGAGASRAVAAEIRGDIRSAFGADHAPGTLFVFASDLLATHVPFDLVIHAGGAFVGGAMGFENAVRALDLGPIERACRSEPRAEAAGARPDAFHVEASSSPLLPPADLARVTSLRIDEPNRQVVLVRDGSRWKVSPSGVAAASDNVEKTLENLGEITLGPSLVADESLGLGPKQGTRVVVSAGDDVLVDFTFGRSGQRGTAVRVAGASEPRLAHDVSSWLFQRELRDWRDRVLWTLDRDDVQRIEIAKRHKWVLRRTGASWRATVDGQPFAALDPDRVARLVDAFRHPMAEDFADAPPDPSATIVRFTLKDGRHHTLRIGDARPDRSHAAQVEGSPTVYVIGPYVAEAASDDPAYWRGPPRH